MIVLKNYNFLKPLIKKGQANKNDPFKKNGLCFADKKRNPNHVYVFHFEDGVIWATYGYTKAVNKSFYKFHKEVSKIMFMFKLPILRKGKNKDFKNHTKLIGIDENNNEIYKFFRGS